MHARKGLPAFATIQGAKYIPTRNLPVHAPSGHIHYRGVGRVDSHVVDDVIISAAKMGETCPACATISRQEQSARAGAQENPIGVMRIISKAANIAAVRSNG